MARNHADAQPGRVLTEAEWQDLHERIQAFKSISVAEHCKAAGVSRARYYVRFPVRPKNENTHQANPAGV